MASCSAKRDLSDVMTGDLADGMAAADLIERQCSRSFRGNA
jgi:hypothetical protein